VTARLPLRVLALPLACAAILGLDACTIRKVSVEHHVDIVQLPPVHERAFSPSFDCGEAASAVQDMVCGSPALSSLDKELAAAMRRQLRQADLIGRDQLLATQRHWLVTRRSACAIPPARQQDLSPDPELETCLVRLYHERIAAVSGWSVPAHGDAVAPIAAYVGVKGAEYRDPGLCTPLSGILAAAVQRNGDLDPSHLPELSELAGTHGAGSVDQPYRLAVTSYEGGADQSYQLRARTLFAGAGEQPALDQTAFTAWVKAQPNSGGRFSLVASDAKDFAAIDIIRYQGRLLALAVEPWGYYSPAAIGESSYAGIFEILGPGKVEPRCLYKTYLRPPTHGGFDALPNYTQLTALLDALQGMAPEDFDPNDRREAHLFEQELRWTLLNLPLIGTAEVRQAGWVGWLHRREDATLDALFAWSERDLPSKLLYRKLVARLRPVQDELAQEFQQAQGLTPGEAGQAAELVLVELLEHSIGTYPGSAAIEAARPATLLAYHPRFSVAPLPGDLEGGRPIRSLHSAVLNQLPAEALADYVKYEFLTPGHAHSTGAGGETSLMAAVEVPDDVALLLLAGANPNEGNAWHKTALMAAAQADQPEAARQLLEGGASAAATTIPWTADEGGIAMFQIHTGNRTALMYAAANAHPALIKLLLDHGAKASDRDTAGRSACEYLTDNAGLAAADKAAARAMLCR
jgi:uncharacterized protein YecT (DUF1311 family)